jgi:hypothetical protein
LAIEIDPERVVIRFLAEVTRKGALSPRSADPRLRDPVAELVVEALLVEGASNVSGIARWIALAKGKCARETVRRRVHDLSTLGIVQAGPRGRYTLSDSFMRMWTRFVMGGNDPQMPSHLQPALAIADSPATDQHRAI